MTIDEAIKHCEEVAEEQDKLCKQYDDASRYARSHNKDIVSANAKKCLECFECAKEHRQLAEWLKDYKKLLSAIEDIKGEVELRLCDVVSEYTDGYSTAIRGVLRIIDEHTSGKRKNDERRSNYL